MFKWLRAFVKRKDSGQTTALSPEVAKRIQQVETVLGITVENASYYIKALRHRSKLVDEDLKATDSYEQLEFLGDAVLDLIIAELLFQRYPNENEGFMTKARSRLVKGHTLAKISRSLQLNDLIEIGERAQDQGIASSKSVLADIFEALIGAIYRDTGLGAARDFVTKAYTKHINIDDIVHTLDNYKSALLEYTQGNKLGVPVYKVIDESGPPHQRIFTVEVLVEGEKRGEGSGTNKKKAEQKSAYEALNSYNALNSF